MEGYELIRKYFGDRLTPEQEDRFRRMGAVYEAWNAKINVISRKDIGQVYPHHILHSLAIAKVREFRPGEKVMDIGCGGGFPGVPLAVLFPETEFILVDSIGKKITVVEEVCRELGIRNVTAVRARAEEVRVQVDHVVSRAVTRLDKFMDWAWGKIVGGDGRGVIYLKGGDLAEEIAEGMQGVKRVESVDIYEISCFFEEEFFETKKIISIKKGKK